MAGIRVTEHGIREGSCSAECGRCERGLGVARDTRGAGGKQIERDARGVRELDGCARQMHEGCEEMR